MKSVRPFACVRNGLSFNIVDPKRCRVSLVVTFISDMSSVVTEHQRIGFKHPTKHTDAEDIDKNCDEKEDQTKR